MHTGGTFVAPYGSDYVALAKATVYLRDGDSALVDDQNMGTVHHCDKIAVNDREAKNNLEALAYEAGWGWSVLSVPYYFAGEVFVLVSYDFILWDGED